MTRFRLLELHVRISFRFRDTFCESTFILLREDTEKVRERERERERKEREIQKENKSRKKERMKEGDSGGEKREGEKNRNALSE